MCSQFKIQTYFQNIKYSEKLTSLPSTRSKGTLKNSQTDTLFAFEARQLATSIPMNEAPQITTFFSVLNSFTRKLDQ